MPELTREEKLKLVEKLPQRLQDLLYSEDTGAFLLYLGQKYNLPDEKVSALSKLVGDIVLGIIPITSLAQEINSKIISDARTAMSLAQELDAELLAPAMAPAPSAPALLTPANAPPRSVAPPAAPPISRPADQYREPVAVPEVINLRKAPPAPLPPRPLSIPAPTPKPIMPTPAAPIPPKPSIPPLIFTHPVEPARPPALVLPPRPAYANKPPLIEADPHKIPPAPALRPQYIMRPSGAPPAGRPENILDLRKDKGEF